MAIAMRAVFWRSVARGMWFALDRQYPLNTVQPIKVEINVPVFGKTLPYTDIFMEW